MRRAAAWLAMGMAGLALAACSGAQDSLNPAGDQAAHTQDVWRLMLIVCGAMYVLVMAFLGWALWRARRALDGPPLEDAVKSSADAPMRNALVGWTALIILGLGVLAVGSFLVDRSLARADTKDALHIKITGNQWWWQVEYQDPDPSRQFTTANELHLPANRPAILELAAQDVIHSFWIPNLAGKEDLIPGRTNWLTLNPRRIGVYRGQCAEFCGLQHAQMALDATVEDPQAFEAWRQAQLKPAPPPSNDAQVRGQGVFINGACGSCHEIAGSDAHGRTGPDLTHLASRRKLAAGALPVGRDGLIAWLHDPQAIKPGNHMPLVHMSDQDLNDLVAYLQSLS
ncbi:MAG: cytochrome c oxidase subunit II [Caulobacterales bacterium]|nr:cytochrome c oxidase subunit II [Caulobacterales bacterium]